MDTTAVGVKPCVHHSRPDYPSVAFISYNVYVDHRHIHPSQIHFLAFTNLINHEVLRCSTSSRVDDACLHAAAAADDDDDDDDGTSDDDNDVLVHDQRF